MSAHSRFTALREVVRAAARAAQGESTTAVGLDRLCALARQRGVGERLLRPSLVIAARACLAGESTTDALLLGDAALLAGLYGSLGAFPLRLPLAATMSATDSGSGELPMHLRARGGVLGVVPLGPLAELVR